MSFEMTAKDRIITVYNLLAGTQEFIGKGDAFIPAHTGLPANCTTIEPPKTKAGFTAVFDADAQQWKQSEDHRGETVFSTETGVAVSITAPGAYPEGTTTIAPENPWQKWDGNGWVDDAEAAREALVSEAEEHKKSLIKQANEAIATLQDAVDLEMATDDEKQSLVEFKKFRVLVSRIIPEDAPDITWPEIPDYVA